VSSHSSWKFWAAALGRAGVPESEKPRPADRKSMMPKNGYRFSENIMLQQKPKAGWR
jgi:hypothetical protein